MLQEARHTDYLVGVISEWTEFEVCVWGGGLSLADLKKQPVQSR